MNKFKVGDRVKCVSEDKNAPRGIVGTVISTEGRLVEHKDRVEIFPYIVKYDEGQNPLVDALFPHGTPEDEQDIELLEET